MRVTLSCQASSGNTKKALRRDARHRKLWVARQQWDVSCRSRLTAIKTLHTAIWTVMAGSILALPFLAWRGKFLSAAAITALILVECMVLALNGGRCPLTDWAAKYTQDRADNFDIYLPLWLARYNKAIFGTLFVLNEAVVVLRFVTTR